ncbi:FtsQ-type POTRA domain-containing protein [Pseudonocardia ailaonensis]|uniref:FtsQ-type POTRA domain-containing protein n=1 Tax=Pseudonocardia ailaonensis TaxID=367279 RepID=A0ABN2MT36_9PSEU
MTRPSGPRTARPATTAAERARRIRAERTEKLGSSGKGEKADRTDGTGQDRNGKAWATRARTSQARAGKDRTGNGTVTDRARGRGKSSDEPPETPKRPLDKRFTRRRRIALLVVVLALLGALATGAYALLFWSGLADVEDVQVSGTLSVSRDEVLSAAAVQTGGPLAAVDTKAIADRVADVTGVGAVVVSRNWPHTVAIAVTERVAVALARGPQGLTLVDAKGVAYQPAPQVPPVLPVLGFGAVGPDDPATKAALSVLAALPDTLRPQVTTIDVDTSVGAPTVRLGLGDRQVLFGSPDRADKKVAVLVPLLTQKGETFDVSSPELPTITR